MADRYVPDSMAVEVEKIARKVEKRLGARMGTSVVELYAPCDDIGKALYRFESKDEKPGYQGRLEKALGNDFSLELIDKDAERSYVEIYPPSKIGRIIEIRKMRKR
jgi:hypothetical protein